MEEMIRLLHRHVNYSGELKLSKEMTDIFFRWLNAINVVNNSFDEQLKIYEKMVGEIKEKVNPNEKSN